MAEQIRDADGGLLGTVEVRDGVRELRNASGSLVATGDALSMLLPRERR